jgi:hypothetical protein
MGQDLAGHMGVMLVEVTRWPLVEVRLALGHLAHRHLGQDLVSRSPAMMASIMARPDIVMISRATELSLIPLSWRTFSNRCFSVVRMSTMALR